MARTFQITTLINSKPTIISALKVSLWYLHDFNEKNLLSFFKNLKSNKKMLDKYRMEMLSGLKKSNFSSFRPSIITDYLEKFS